MSGSAMDAEFDDVAAWTADAVERLGPDHAIPAACRGSASPAALAWLGEACELAVGARLLDLGAGLGGPAAWAAQRFGVRPVLLEPMAGACRAAAGLFRLPVASASGSSIPLRSASIDAAWCLGVLCTTEDKAGLLDELHRVLVPGAPLGLLVLVAHTDQLQPAPEGNSFPTVPELSALLDGSGFELIEQIDAPGQVPLSWTARADRVEESIEAAHRDEFAQRQAVEQGRRLATLLTSGQVSTRLVHAINRYDGH